MKIRTYSVLAQVYLLPYVKVTHDRFLNGDIEIIIGWFNKGIVFSI
jgi:hypothetical protein